MNRDILALALTAVGGVALTIAGFLVSPEAGFGVLGGFLIVEGYLLGAE